MCRSILIQSSFLILLMLMLGPLSLNAYRADFISVPVSELSPDLNSITSMSTSKSKKSGKSACERLSSIYRSPVTIHGKPTASPAEARVVEWQTRAFEGRMPKGLRVQVPPRALLFLPMRNEAFWLPHPSV